MCTFGSENLVPKVCEYMYSVYMTKSEKYFKVTLNKSHKIHTSRHPVGKHGWCCGNTFASHRLGVSGLWVQSSARVLQLGYSLVLASRVFLRVLWFSSLDSNSIMDEGNKFISSQLSRVTLKTNKAES
jgi:hypothetical protein